MSERDALEHLAAATRRESPDPEFAADLLDRLLDELSVEPTQRPHVLEVVELQEDTGMNQRSRTRRWVLVAAAAVLVAVVGVVVALPGRDDDNPVVDTAPTVSSTSTVPSLDTVPTSSAPAPTEIGNAGDPLPRSRLRMDSIELSAVNNTLRLVGGLPESLRSTRVVRDAEFGLMQDNLPARPVDSDPTCTVGDALVAVEGGAHAITIATADLEGVEVILVAVGTDADERTGVMLDAVTCDVVASR